MPEAICMVNIVDLTLSPHDVVGSVTLVASSIEEAKDKAFKFIESQPDNLLDKAHEYHVNVTVLAPIPVPGSGGKSVIIPGGETTKQILQTK